jgi:hypothetical protein
VCVLNLFAGDPKVRSLRLSNPKLNDTVGRFPGAQDIFTAFGFRPVAGSTDGLMTMRSQDENVNLTEMIRDLLAAEALTLGAEVPPAPVIDRSVLEQAEQIAREVEASFDPYKSYVMRVGSPDKNNVVVQARTLEGSVTVTESATESKVSEIKRKMVAIQEANRPRERKTQITLWDPETSSNPLKFSDADKSLTSAYDEVDESDPEARKLYMEYAKKKMAEMNEEKGFKTQAQRDLESLQNSKVYTAALIRILFPDRTSAQGVFSPLDTLADVYKWVGSLLAAPYSDFTLHPFRLYRSPPVTISLPSDATIQDSKLTPATAFHFTWGTNIGTHTTPIGDGSTLAFLSDSAKQTITSAAGAWTPLSRPVAAGNSGAGNSAASTSAASAVASGDDDALAAMAAALLGGGSASAGAAAAAPPRPTGSASNNKAIPASLLKFMKK